MKLGFEEAQSPYKSASQSARIWTERWVRDSLYCPSCGNSRVEQFEGNRPVADFFCLVCKEEYELKSQKSRFGRKVVDGAFRTMCDRLTSSNNPNLLLLNYDLKQFGVVNLFVVPKHFFVRGIIEERKALPNHCTAGRLDRLQHSFESNSRVGEDFPRTGGITSAKRRSSRPMETNAILARGRHRGQGLADRSDEMC